MVQEGIDNEIRDFARDFMMDSKLMQLPGHVKEAADILMWKLFREKRKNSGSTPVRWYRCKVDGHLSLDAFNTISI